MKFGLIGAAGYVAPRHMKAIKDTGNELVVALDPNDSVGILDTYFPDCKFFTQVERFDRHILKNETLDYISVCSPNYLHESHIKLGLRLGANIICEKPLVLCAENISQLQKVEDQMGKKIYSILQLRLHPTIQELKKRIKRNKKYHVDLQYITPRGPWYFQSWKGNFKRSGGIETNIGIHFFDVMLWLFGKCEKFEISHRDNTTSIGKLYLESAEVSWFLSLNRNDLPFPDLKFFRTMYVGDHKVNFDGEFEDLHTISYREILNDRGFGVEETYDALELVTKIRETR